MADGMVIEVKVDLDRMEQKLGKAALERAQELYAIKALDLMTPFVPRRENILAPTADIASDFKNGILTWTTPYARYQYDLDTANRTTPGTNGHWDDLLAQDSKMQNLREYAAALLEGRA